MVESRIASLAAATARFWKVRAWDEKSAGLKHFWGPHLRPGSAFLHLAKKYKELKNEMCWLQNTIWGNCNEEERAGLGMLVARGWLSKETFAFHTAQCDRQRNIGSPQAQQNGSKLQQIPNTQLQINPCTGFPIPPISSVHGSKGAIRNVGTLTPKTNKKF